MFSPTATNYSFARCLRRPCLHVSFLFRGSQCHNYNNWEDFLRCGVSYVLCHRYRQGQPEFVESLTAHSLMTIHNNNNRMSQMWKYIMRMLRSVYVLCLQSADCVCVCVSCVICMAYSALHIEWHLHVQIQFYYGLTMPINRTYMLYIYIVRLNSITYYVHISTVHR